MKKVTTAYEKDDLFELLKLQIEYRNRDLQDMHILPEEQLKYYNKLLKDQVEELKAMKYTLEYPPYIPLQEMIERFELTKVQRTIDRAFKREIQEVKEDMKRIDTTLDILQDKKRTKQFLKNVFEERQQETMEIDFFDLLMNRNINFDNFK